MGRGGENDKAEFDGIEGSSCEIALFPVIVSRAFAVKTNEISLIDPCNRNMERYFF